mmetsp:Transcript_102388/g.219102  ORF Transcript_102388/g.219102 Transcript_102388/m.219102 type:complete len:115 (-) Transcript_102388:48-392(-)
MGGSKSQCCASAREDKTETYDKREAWNREVESGLVQRKSVDVRTPSKSSLGGSSACGSKYNSEDERMKAVRLIEEPMHKINSINRQGTRGIPLHTSFADEEIEMDEEEAEPAKK